MTIAVWIIAIAAGLLVVGKLVAVVLAVIAAAADQQERRRGQELRTKLQKMGGPKT